MGPVSSSRFHVHPFFSTCSPLPNPFPAASVSLSQRSQPLILPCGGCQYVSMILAHGVRKSIIFSIWRIYPDLHKCFRVICLLQNCYQNESGNLRTSRCGDWRCDAGGGDRREFRVARWLPFKRLSHERVCLKTAMSGVCMPSQ